MRKERPPTIGDVIIETPARCVTAFFSGLIGFASVLAGGETHSEYRARMAKEYGREVSDEPPPTPRNKP